MKFIEYFLLRLGISLIFLVVSVPLLVVVFAAISKGEENLRAMRIVGFVVFFSWLFGQGWLVHRTANYMMFNNMKLGAAIRTSLGDVRLRLCFLPIVGRLFTPNEEKVDDSAEDDSD